MKDKIKININEEKMMVCNSCHEIKKISTMFSIRFGQDISNPGIMVWLCQECFVKLRELIVLTDVKDEGGD